MKSHPVPQNIMDVEFKLFGELTIRQFGYVAGGALVAFVCYVSFADIPLIRWPLVVFFGILGIMLAVFKVNDRPFEIWLANFIFALFTSQRRIWKKSAKTPEILRSMNVNSVSKGNSNVSINRAPLSSVYVPTEEVEENISKEDKEEMDRLNEIDKLWGGSSNKVVENTKTTIKEVVQNVPIAVPTVTSKEEVIQTFSEPAISIPKDIEVKKTEDIKEVKKIPRFDLDDILPTKVSREDLIGKMDEKTGVDQPAINFDEPVVNTKVATVLEEKKEEVKDNSYMDKLKTQLEEQNKIINNLREKVSEPKEVVETKKIVLEEKPEIKEEIKKIEQVIEEKPIEKVNYVSGTVKDKNGKGLSNVTLIIKDSKFRPVRATRTNNLGAFNITTSLPNGDYSLEAVRSGMNFDTIDFILDGTDSKEFELVSI